MGGQEVMEQAIGLKLRRRRGREIESGDSSDEYIAFSSIGGNWQSGEGRGVLNHRGDDVDQVILEVIDGDDVFRLQVDDAWLVDASHSKPAIPIECNLGEIEPNRNPMVERSAGGIRAFSGFVGVQESPHTRSGIVEEARVGNEVDEIVRDEMACLGAHKNVSPIVLAPCMKGSEAPMRVEVREGHHTAVTERLLPAKGLVIRVVTGWFRRLMILRELDISLEEHVEFGVHPLVLSPGFDNVWV